MIVLGGRKYDLIKSEEKWYEKTKKYHEEKGHRIDGIEKAHKQRKWLKNWAKAFTEDLRRAER